MRRGYIREADNLPSLEDQTLALLDAGVVDPGQIYIDWLSKRSTTAIQGEAFQQAVGALQPHDELAIACASVLGGRQSVLQCLQAIGACQASLFDADTNTRVTYIQEALPMFALANRAEFQIRTAILKRARLQKIALGATGGRPKRLTGQLAEEAAAHWADLRFTAAEVVAKFGVSESTFRRRFGPKGTPMIEKAAK